MPQTKTNNRLQLLRSLDKTRKVVAVDRELWIKNYGGRGKGTFRMRPAVNLVRKKPVKLTGKPSRVMPKSSRPLSTICSDPRFAKAWLDRVGEHGPCAIPA